MTTRFTLKALAVTAVLGLSIGTAQAGKVYISGQDSDDNGHVATSFGAQLLTHVGTGNTNGGSGILILGGYTSTSASNINAWNAVALQTLTPASGAAAIAAVNFSSFAGILMPSVSFHTSGGITQLELNAINARATDIANFVNAGGNLMAFTQDGLSGAFGWFPLGPLTTSPISTAQVSQTAALAAAGFIATNAQIAGDLYHNNFLAPAGFYGLSVLATQNVGGAAVILGGGTTTQIVVPEPATLALIGAGLAGLGLVRRRRAG
jgi:hypothetical protein